ncbi:MAG TPA: MurT ligase domain-containing protein [Dehalococcoidia bacterium]|nr:MurT ligase domain-containing protein [Dehalococcoidia bacterium]
MDAAVLVAKGASLVLRRLGLGGGTALPGLLALRLDPGLVPRLAAGLGQGAVLVTGTNGKTTTARLLTGMARQAGLRTVANAAGSNLVRGIAAALCQAAGADGRLAEAPRRLGVFEVDEATLPEAVALLSPRVVVFLNLFRDQLDRYGEVDHVAVVWRRSLAALGSGASLVLNADDPAVASLAHAARGPVLFYGLAPGPHCLPAPEHAADARWCPSCAGELAYECVHYAHLGLWRCPECGLSRPTPQLEGFLGGRGLGLRLPDGDQRVLPLPMEGTYAAYDTMAAVGAALALGLPWSAMEQGVAAFGGAFGRQERLTVQGRQVQVVLAKNPAGLNQVLRTLCRKPPPLRLALFLNDGLADGRDVSWIWDVDFELLSGRVEWVVASGSRAEDLALRLHYARLGGELAVEPRPVAALRLAIGRTPPGGTLQVLPTYTALLRVREVLARWAGSRPFWEDGAL